MQYMSNGSADAWANPIVRTRHATIDATIDANATAHAQHAIQRAYDVSVSNALATAWNLEQRRHDCQRRAL